MKNKNSKMILFINTLSADKIFLAMIDDKINQQIVHKIDLNKKIENKIIFYLDKLLRKSNLKLRNLKGIIVLNGPGSFTQIRVVLTLVNILSYILGIKAVGVKQDLNNELKFFPRVSERSERELSKTGVGENLKLIKNGLRLLSKKKAGQSVQPFYKYKPNITLSSR